MQIDQRKKLELLDYRMRHPSPSPVKGVNNFANIKQKLNGFDIYKEANQDPKDLHNEEDEEDDRNENNYLSFGEHQQQGSLDFMNKNILEFNGDNYLFCTPPIKNNNNYGIQSNLMNDINLNRKISEDEDEEEIQKQNGNDSDEEEEEEDEESEENEIQEEESEQEQQDKTGSYHSINKDVVANNDNQQEKQKQTLPPKKLESIEPSMKKGRILNSQKILFQENTLPNEGDKKQFNFRGNDLTKKGDEVKGIVNQIVQIQNKVIAKSTNKNQKKISKITDYLNSDLMQNKNGNNNNNGMSKSTGNSNSADNELIYQLQSELKQKDQQLNQKQKQIESLENLVNKLKQNQTIQRSAATSGQNSINTASSDFSKIKKMIQRTFLDNSILNRKLIKMQLQQSKQRLGEYIVQDLLIFPLVLFFQNKFLNIKKSDLSNFREQWIDGFEVQELYNQLKQVEKKISHYDGIYQNLKNLKPKKKVQSLNGKQQKLTLSGALNDPLNQAASNQDSNSKSLFDDDEEFDITIYPNQAVAHEEQKRFTLFQIALLEKQKQIIVQNLDQKKKEVKEIIKKYQLQYLEENSRFGGLQVDDPWPVLGSRYQLLSLLGKGGFSEVYKAIDLEEFREVAIKIHYIDKTWSNSTKQNYLKHAFREHGIQKELDHPNIVKLYDYIEIDSTSFASVLQFCEGPDLSQHLKIHQTIIEQDAKYIVKKILECLEYLNSFQSKVIHYDLKPQNIIFHKGQIKITDFGLSKIIEDNATRLELTSQGVGTYWYLPPECFESFGNDDEQAPQISSKVDIWSVGVIFFEMLYGQKPFGNKMSQQQILQQNTILNSKEVKFPSKPIISKDAQSFIVGCLKHNQEERFDIKQALNHPYFKKL